MENEIITLTTEQLNTGMIKAYLEGFRTACHQLGGILSIDLTITGLDKFQCNLPELQEFKPVEPVND